MLARELLDAACGGMDAHEQLVEGERVAFGHDELAVEHERFAPTARQRGDDLREIAVERLAGFRAQLDFVAILEGEAAKAVELGLVLPLAAGRQLGDELRLHRRVRSWGSAAPRGFSRSCARSKRPRFASSGAQRSPSSAMRAGMLSMRKSSMRDAALELFPRDRRGDRGVRLRTRRVHRRERAAPGVLVVVDEHASGGRLAMRYSAVMSVGLSASRASCAKLLREASTLASASDRARSGRRRVCLSSRSSWRAASCPAPSSASRTSSAVSRTSSKVAPGTGSRSKCR